MAVGHARIVLCSLIVLVALAASGTCCPELRSCFPDDIVQLDCVANGPSWTLEPSPFDCSIYLNCFNGIGFQNCCPIGQYFNPNTAGCDDEANVDCDIEPPPCPEDSTLNPDTTVTDETTTEDPDATTTTDGAETTTEDSDATTTTDGAETTTDDPDATTTTDSAETTTEDPDATTSTTEDPDTTTEDLETTTVEQGPDLDALCAAQPSESLVELAFPEECDKFVLCQAGELVGVESCPVGLHFNPILNVCDSPDHAECLDFVCRNNPQGSQSELASLNSCQQYFICVGNTTVVRVCSPGTIYDAEDGWCIIDDVDNPCRRERPPPPPLAVIEQCRGEAELFKIPHPEKCDVYYRCLNGRLSVRQCPPGLLFDIDREQCNLEENVVCVNTRKAPA